jgi:hypothetical protein
LALRMVSSTVLSWRHLAEREVRALAVVSEAPFAHARVERGQVFKQVAVKVSDARLLHGAVEPFDLGVHTCAARIGVSVDDAG